MAWLGQKIADCDRTISRLHKIFHNLQIGVQFQNAQCSRLHGTETLDLSRSDHANPYDTMEPELSCLISPRCKIGESHTGNMQTRDQELSQWDLDNRTGS